MVRVSIMLLDPRDCHTRHQYAYYEGEAETNLSEIMKDLVANQCTVRNVRYARIDTVDLFEIEVI